MISFSIEEGRLDDIIHILKDIPEFNALPDKEEIHKRIIDVPHLILVGYVDHSPAGFKIGYERDGHFYSWLGAVAPPFRRIGLASALADHQEAWVRNQGYKAIWMKTRNRFPAMLLMAMRRGFQITKIDPRDQIGDHRIVLAKSL